MSSRREKRDSPRIAVEVNALLRVTAEGEDRIYQSRTRDLSAGGVCIVVDRRTEDLEDRVRSPGARVLIALELRRKGSEVKTVALPVWIRSATDWVETPEEGGPSLAIGFSFIDIGEAEAGEIRAFLAEQTGRSA